MSGTTASTDTTTSTATGETTTTNGDPAMVINDPYGNFYCVDDSFGTVNPTIDFNNPAGGSYDVWIASSTSNATVSGTFYITGNSGNHP